MTDLNAKAEEMLDLASRSTDPHGAPMLAQAAALMFLAAAVDRLSSTADHALGKFNR